MLRLVSAGCLALLLLPISLTAQEQAQEGQQAQMQDDQNPTLVVSQWKCDWREVENIVDSMEEVLVPVWDRMVDEGTLVSAGVFVHEWGDEWNVNMYRIAPDREAFFRAYEEEGPAVEEQLGELNIAADTPSPLQEHCTEHRDNIYVLGPRTGMQQQGQQ